MLENVNDEFISFLCRIFLFQLSGPIERAKYYAIWTLTEVCIFSLC
jgi:lysophospholipid acyltransferase